MKRLTFRILTATALATAAAGALAQSNVTIFGTMDLSAAHVTAAGKSITGLSHSGANVSRIGFRGTEDLGGGLSAGFWLESAVNPDTGGTSPAGFWNRRATVSLTSKWGELRLGRDDSVTFLNTLVFDPFLTNGVGGTMAFVMNGAPTIQISNAVSYLTPSSLGGFYGQLQVAAGEGAPTGGKYTGGRLGYRNGPLHLSAAAANLEGATQSQDQRFRNAAASYDFGVAQPMLLWATHKVGNVEVRAIQLGVKVPFGPHEVKASFGHYNTVGSDADWRKFAIGYAYNLSKRTQLYSAYARLNNSDGASKVIGVQGITNLTNTAGDNSNGYQLGIRHFF